MQGKHPIVVTPDFDSDSTSLSTDQMAHVEAAKATVNCTDSTEVFEIWTFDVDLGTGDLTLSGQPQLRDPVARWSA